MYIRFDYKVLHLTVSPRAAESIAVLMAIDLCWEKGFTHVHLQGDSKNLVDAVNAGDGADWSPMGHVIADIKVGLRIFQQWQMSFVKSRGV
jgi:ribonuclease HI